MRPRHYTGESRENEGDRELICRASMRPRHYTGESAPGGAVVSSGALASMRPRHYTGESHAQLPMTELGGLASMRPRHYTGESPRATSWRPERRVCFNEAPALHRGKCGLGHVGQTYETVLQ